MNLLIVKAKLESFAQLRKHSIHGTSTTYYNRYALSYQSNIYLFFYHLLHQPWLDEGFIKLLCTKKTYFKEPYKNFRFLSGISIIQ